MKARNGQRETRAATAPRAILWHDDDLALADPLPQVRLRCRVSGEHPWVYRRMLERPRAGLKPGVMVEALTKEGVSFGRGFYNPNSEIALRLLTRNPKELPDAAWFSRKIASAVALRHDVLDLRERTDAYRLIHAEGDGISGLAVDRFAGVLVAEIYCAGVRRHWRWIAAALREHFPDAPLLARGDERAEVRERVLLGATSGGSVGEGPEIQEDGVKYRVDLAAGHKTGFFLDQRDHRREVARLCIGKELFDGCCYSGGFALSALKGGARFVEAVDLDESAIALAKVNARRNGLAGNDRLKLRHANVFDVLRHHAKTGRRFGRIVLDPPKLAATKEDLPKALQAYADMNRLALECLVPGGVLVTSSCSGLVSEEAFLDVLRRAASQAGVTLQVFRVAGAAPDHPVAISAPEGRYLKVVYARALPAL
ncbi:MAG: class I SAM-dependent rRNA methyltransferase [Planctomycetes bacterium]|nr:class I SAM-dependent rRNA methyltransferase [Planctomycetota bacterium]